MSEFGEAENRVMFSSWDGGRCHFTRTMALAEEAQSRGMEVGFIVSEKFAPEIGSLAVPAEVHVIPNRPENNPPPPYEFPLYSHIFKHAQRLRGLGFDNAAWLQDITEREIAAIQDFNPGVIVNDYRDTIRTSAQVRGVPVVGITHTTGNLDGKTFGWWVTPPEDARLPDCRDSFNEVRENFGLAPIADEREMFSGDISLIPSSPSLEPTVRDSDTTHYVGILSKWKPGDSGFDTIPSDVADPRVFSYVGETSRPQYGYEGMLTEVIQREPGMGFYVVGDRSRYANETIAARERQGSVKVESFIPGPTAIGDSVVTLNHGGHGTTMLSLSLGKPLICIGPYQSECATSFRGAEEHGAGIMLNHSTGPLERRKAPDLGDDIDIFGYWRSELTADRIHDAIREVVEDERYTTNAQRLGSELLELGGVERAMDIIQATAAS